MEENEFNEYSKYRTVNRGPKNRTLQEMNEKEWQNKRSRTIQRMRTMQRI